MMDILSDIPCDLLNIPMCVCVYVYIYIYIDIIRIYIIDTMIWLYFQNWVCTQNDNSTVQNIRGLYIYTYIHMRGLWLKTTGIEKIYMISFSKQLPFFRSLREHVQ